MSKLNILVLTAYPPALGMHGGALRMYYNIQFLSKKHKVTVISFIEHEQDNDRLQSLTPLGVKVRAVPRTPSEFQNFGLPKPVEHFEFSSREMSSAVREVLNKQAIDVIQAEYLQMAQHVPRSATQLKILTQHEIGYANAADILKQENRLWAKIRKIYDWMVQLNYEINYCRYFDVIVCMTNEDFQRLAEFIPLSKLKTINIGVDSHFFDASSKPVSSYQGNKVLFVGNYRHKPNRESVYYFIKYILPNIQKSIPDIEFWVVGGNAEMLDSTILNTNAGVHVKGYVEDVRPFYRDCTIFVAPIISGNGMRVKLLEAFSMGMPVVASPLAVHGFCVKANEELIIASSQKEFSLKIVDLLRNKKQCIDLGFKARKLICESYDWSTISQQFLDLVESRHV